MVAAPRYGTATFKKTTKINGVSITQTIHKEIYVSDVDADFVTWDAGDGAGTTAPDEYIPNGIVTLFDISLASGLTDTQKMELTIGGQKTGDFFTYANHVNTLSYRVPISIICPAGLKVAFIQRAN